MIFFITGTAGFIGFHLADRLLREGHIVHGYDGFTDYYDVSLKRHRNGLLHNYSNFTSTEALLEDESVLNAAIEAAKPDVIVHLAAQAGVRYSLDNPRAYIDANIIGTFNVLEAARRIKVKHLLLASTSSVYGANEDMPYMETHKADTQMSFYAATKKSNEVMSHAYAHLHGIPTTAFRFFTVYGPWGRPDMAIFKFAKAILEDRPIDIYNFGDMWRDFTYIEDLISGIVLLIAIPPAKSVAGYIPIENDSLSPVAPFRIVNIGNSTKVRLLDFIDALEVAIGKKAMRNYIEMQAGDVPATWADASLLKHLTGYKPTTDFHQGVASFARWFKDFYSK